MDVVTLPFLGRVEFNEAGDVLTLTSACLLLVAAAVVAAAYPTRQAMRVDPAVALRAVYRLLPSTTSGCFRLKAEATNTCSSGFRLWPEGFGHM